MTFDFNGIVIFLLAIIPGIIAEQSRHLIVPRSLEKKSTIEETGEYFINSLLVHTFFLMVFGLSLYEFHSPALAALAQDVPQKKLPGWAWEHRYLALCYLATTLIGGYFFGFLRGVLAVNQPFRTGLGGYRWFSLFMEKLGILFAN